MSAAYLASQRPRVLAAARDLMARAVYPSVGRLAEATGLPLSLVARLRNGLVLSGELPRGDDPELSARVLEVCRDLMARDVYPCLDRIAEAVGCPRGAVARVRDLLVERGDLDGARLAALTPHRIPEAPDTAARDARCREACRALIARGIRPGGPALAKEIGYGSEDTWRQVRNRLIDRGELEIPEGETRSLHASDPDRAPAPDAEAVADLADEIRDEARAPARPRRPPRSPTERARREFRRAWRNIRGLLPGEVPSCGS